MKIAISIFLVALCIYGGWELFLYWDKVSHEEYVDPDTVAVRQIYGEALDGMPKELENTYKAAVKMGPSEVKKFLKKYAKNIQDPRLAWIELDYMVSIARDDPQEAKKIFADVKGRVPETDRIYPRIHQLSKTYE